MSELFICSRCKMKYEEKDFGFTRVGKRYKICAKCRTSYRENQLERVREIMKEKHVECLESEYIKSVAKMRWLCTDCHHGWEASFASVGKSRGCPKCKRIKTKITLEKVREVAEDRNITCLETKYRNMSVGMMWQCNICLYEWRTHFNNFRRANGCPKCNGMVKYTPDELQDFASKWGVECMTDEYINSALPVPWKCKICNFSWKTSLSNFKKKKEGCPRCCKNKAKYNIKEVKEIAESRDIICLSEKYVDCRKPMLWKCKKCNREWETTFRSLKQNIGCLPCSARLGLDHVQEILKDRDITCLEKEYKNSQCKMLWQCDICSYKWDTTFTHIKHSKSGCPNCASWKSERMCREIFQSFMGYNFPKKRPEFLQGLELDGFCKELKISFEYQGRQHYEDIPFFHRTENSLEELQERDRLKKELCQKNGITLIEIPHTYDHRDKEGMENFVMQKLVEGKFLLKIFLPSINE